MDEEKSSPLPPPPVATPDAVKEGEPSDKPGTVEKKLADIENNIFLVQVVLGVGFLAIAITIILFAISAYNERTSSYNDLLKEYYRLDAGICRD